MVRFRKKFNPKNPQAHRGKNFEAETEALLTKFAKRATFFFMSLNDTYRAQGARLPSVLSDFLCQCPKGAVALECKESIEPYLNYKKRMKQLGRLYKFARAGGKAFFLVRHKDLTYALDVLKVWKYKKNNKRKSYPFKDLHRGYRDFEKLLRRILGL